MFRQKCLAPNPKSTELLRGRLWRRGFFPPLYAISPPGESLDTTLQVECLELGRLYQQEAQLLLGDRATRKHAKDCRIGHENDKLG